MKLNDWFLMGGSLAAMIGLLTFSACNAEQQAQAKTIIDMMPNVCARGMAWEVCVEKCKAKQAEGEGGAR